MSRKEKGDEKGKGFRGWDWKQPSWGFSESKPNTIVNGDFSVDLNLGRLESRSGGDQWQDPTKVSMVVSSSPLGTSKKARAPPSNDPQTVSCLVDGCASDLSKCRDYYRRHKICETHSKTPIVLVGGQEQRFCQQCSRLHLVVEFDEAKRSCRKRLDGHNRRRRKSQLEPFPMNVGSLCSNYQGNQYLSFSNPQFYQPAGTDSPRQRGLTTTEDDAMHYGHHLSYQNGGQNQLPRSFSCNFNGGEQHPFPQPDNPGLGNRRIIPEVSFSRPLVNTSGSSSESSGFRRVGLDSDRALSLLSSQSSRPSSSGVSSGNHIAQTNPTRMDQPLVGGGACLQYADLVSRYHQSQRTEDNAHVDQRGIFHTGTDGPMGIAAHPFPFSWE